MRINTVNNNYASPYLKRNNAPSFGDFAYKGLANGREYVAKIFGSQQRADLFEKISTDKGLTVTFFNQMFKRYPKSQGFITFMAEIFDPKPAAGQNARKLMSICDTTTLSDEAILGRAELIRKKHPGLNQPEFLKLVEEDIHKLRDENFKKRLEASIIACKAKYDNIRIGATLDTEETRKLFGSEAVKEISTKIIAEGQNQYNISTESGSAIYNAL